MVLCEISIVLVNHGVATPNGTIIYDHDRALLKELMSDGSNWKQGLPLGFQSFGIFISINEPDIADLTQPDIAKTFTAR